MACPTLPQAILKIIPGDEILPTMERIVAEIREVRERVARTTQPPQACFKNVIKPLIDIENETQGAVGVMAMLRYASPDAISREASDKACKLWVECEAEFNSREDLYLLVKAVKDKSEPLARESAKYLDSLLKDFRLCGHGVLTVDEIKRYSETKNHIEDLRREYNRNIRDDDGKQRFLLQELAGVLPRDLDRFITVSEARQDVVYVPLGRNDVDALLEHASIPSTRKKIYVTNAHKLPQNVEILKEIVAKRDENARLLGYDSHASLKIEKRAARSPGWVMNLLEELEKGILPQGQQEMDHLLKLRAKDLAKNQVLQNDDGHIPPWDFWYYARVAEENFQVDHTKISEYFPMRTTVSAMLDIFASCLQLQFTPLPSALLEGHVWHEEVEVWAVWDKRDTSRDDFIGYIYTDLLSRPNKYRGSQNVNIQRGYLKDDGSRVYPATILMCSFPRPTSLGSDLLKHHEIVSLFHELGHGIHDLISRTSYVRFHGHEVAREFEEALGVMLENWCWTKEELRSMSCHYTATDPKILESWKAKNPGAPVPPKQIPDAILDSLVESRKTNRAIWFLRQLAFSQFDMAIHHLSSHEDALNLAPSDIYHSLVKRLALLETPDIQDRGYPFASIGHLMAGYDAGYFSYISAYVFAADLFETAFAKDPRDQDVWAKFRRDILEPGASLDELDMLERFLGHPPSAEALLRNIRGN
ncbi:uncharacterized protein JN550_002760 [Neoarthrinium moseri]|uniref:uncharacterized protein n=1 Tax=Neoarthrinium moseri TaxID=1658444 RepID=UPI001FDB2A1F|nr:uncharacterized protein JN550_002760 [Neoarthrinium moseri]KAI1874181.1 hypothetical protein JN550_002760 [Neoarthrinium moseri]